MLKKWGQQFSIFPVLNGPCPWDDFWVCKTIIHAINKKILIDKELGWFLEPVDNMFPRVMPYFHFDLTSHCDYILKKAILLSCNIKGGNQEALTTVESKKLLVLGLGIGLDIICVIMMRVALVYFKRDNASGGWICQKWIGCVSLNDSI